MLAPCPGCCKQAAGNTGVNVSSSVMAFSGYMPRSGMAGSFGSSSFNFFFP